jgi:hypothetical protein
MNIYLYKFRPIFKAIVVFSLLLWTLMFTSTASAASRELQPSASAAPIQLAYYNRGHAVRHHNRYNHRHDRHHRHYHYR